MNAERNHLSDRAIQIIADNKIRAGIEASEFANLPGYGQPIASINDPYDPYWWIRQKLKREELSVERPSGCRHK